MCTMSVKNFVLNVIASIYCGAIVSRYVVTAHGVNLAASTNLCKREL